MRFTSRCSVCDDAVKHDWNPTSTESSIHIGETIRALVNLTAAGKMRVLRADVPLEDMIALAESEMRYTISCFLQCQKCRKTKFWGLCIRGHPSHRNVKRGAEQTWPWEPVPSRNTWAGEPTHDLP